MNVEENEMPGSCEKPFGDVGQYLPTPLLALGLFGRGGGRPLLFLVETELRRCQQRIVPLRCDHVLLDQRRPFRRLKRSWHYRVDQDQCDRCRHLDL